jgi:hypothetical protein
MVSVCIDFYGSDDINIALMATRVAHIAREWLSRVPEKGFLYGHF